MYRLYLLRHAEASHATAVRQDFDRPLSDRGRQDAADLGLAMKKAGFVPAFVLCSSALRARQTWEAMTPALASPSIEASYLPELYRGDAADYRILIATSSVEESLLVIGHNPMVQELAFLLLRGGGEARTELSAGFPPGSLAVLDFPEPLWSIAPRTATLVTFLSPRQ